MDANKYSYRVIWSEEDQEFVGLCAEFPGLSWLAKDQVASLQGIVDLVKDSIADMEQNGEKIPEPISLRHYSGRFVVRTTPDMRRHLALAACEAGVGLNRYVNRSIPKSVHDYRIRENAEIFDFCLDAGQMAAIDWLGLPCRKGRTGKDPPVWPPMG